MSKSYPTPPHEPPAKVLAITALSPEREIVKLLHHLADDAGLEPIRLNDALPLNPRHAELHRLIDMALGWLDGKRQPIVTDRGE